MSPSGNRLSASTAIDVRSSITREEVFGRVSSAARPMTPASARPDSNVAIRPLKERVAAETVPVFTRSIHQVIPIIRLARFVTKIFDEPLHVGHTHAEGRTGLRDDVLLDHDAA